MGQTVGVVGAATGLGNRSAIWVIAKDAVGGNVAEVYSLPVSHRSLGYAAQGFGKQLKSPTHRVVLGQRDCMPRIHAAGLRAR